MTPALVIDCSIAMAWCFEDETTPATQAIQDRLTTEAAIVPAHWRLEVVNVLVMAERRNRILTGNAVQFLRLLDTLDVLVDDQTAPRAFDHLLPLCQAHRLSSYDAAYLELAMRLQLPLATLDDDLRRAAMTVGLAVIGV